MAAQSHPHHWSKITEEGVAQLRKDKRAGMTIQQLYEKYGPRFGMTYEGIRAIAYGRTWKQ